MNDTPSIHPFWRALVGAGFAYGIGLAGYIFGFGAAIVLLILVILGGIVGVLAINGD